VRYIDIKQINNKLSIRC